MVINNTNVFAALDTLRKKKKSDKKECGTSKSSSQPDPQVFWGPALVKGTSWADIDDDDNYYATTTPPQSVWGTSEPSQTKDRQSIVEESESEEDILDEGGDDVEDEHGHEHEHDHKPEVPVLYEPVANKLPEVPALPKEAEKQLLKKERKKKELEELEALLADFGVAPKENNGQTEPGEHNKKGGEPSDRQEEKKESAPITNESKVAKKKKKKEKSLKAVKDHPKPNSGNQNNGSDQAVTEYDASAVDMKERMKKISAAKKKKMSKEMDPAAKVAAQEAAVRNARLAAAKKNQQPVR